MRFSFCGNEYRIYFRHDPNRLASAHIGHPVRLRDSPVIEDKIEQFILTVRSQRPILRCEYCKIVISISHAGLPKALRKRMTHCTVQALAKDALSSEGIWVDVFYGNGNPNETEGDRFNKSIGRRASLANALLRENFEPEKLLEPFKHLSNLRATFKTAAWAAFEGRGNR